MNTANRCIKQLLLFLLLSSNICLTVSAATLTATVNRNQVSTNETLLLTLSYNEQVSTSSLDFSVLERDFEVLGASPSSQSSVTVVNGQTKRESTTQWNVTLVPKRLGRLTIPAFAINNDRSQAITINVDDSRQSTAASQPLQVSVRSSHKSLYPAQQLIVEVELSALGNISNLNGPSLIVQGADVEALDQQNFQRIENGVARQVVVLKYAVFPEQAGELVIPIMTFTGVKGNRRSIFGTSGERVVARSRQLTIPVNPAPGKADTPWFPAESVEIRAGWSGDTSQLKVGEPITRTITIRTKGQRAEIVPPLTESATGSDEFKLYKDQAQLDSQATADGFVSTRIESAAIVPAKIPADGGKIVLPALSLDWWDVNDKRWKQARFPAQELLVTGSGAISSDNPVTTTGLETQNTVDPVIPASDDKTRLWQMIAAGLLLLCLIQLWVIVRLRSTQQKASESAARSDQPGERAAWSRLQKTLRTRDLAAIRAELLAWLRSSAPEYQQIPLQTILTRLQNPALTAEVEKLEAYLYKAGPEIDLQQFTQTIDACRRQMRSENKAIEASAAGLKPLYGAGSN